MPTAATKLETFNQTVQRLLDTYATDGGDFAVEAFHRGAWHLQSPRFATAEAAQGWIEASWPNSHQDGHQRVVSSPEAADRALTADAREHGAAILAAIPAMVPLVCQQQQADAGVAVAKPAHTPGPWHRNIKPASKYPTVWSGRNTHVAAISPGAPRGSGNGCTMSEEEQEANINLIAAAPCLLAALREMVDIFREGDDDANEPKAVHDALVAIARAEGRAA